MRVGRESRGGFKGIGNEEGSEKIRGGGWGLEVGSESG